MKTNKSKKANDIARLLRGQLAQGIKAAAVGDSLTRMAVGIDIQKNLKALALLKK